MAFSSFWALNQSYLCRVKPLVKRTSGLEEIMFIHLNITFFNLKKCLNNKNQRRISNFWCLKFADEIFVNQPNYKNQAHIRAKSVWGILRGLESFSHLIYNTKEHGYQVRILICLNSCYINKGHKGLFFTHFRLSVYQSFAGFYIKITRWQHVFDFRL